MALIIIILAAGQGKRMYSDLPKVLHPLAGKPILQHVVDKALELQAAEIFIVYGHGGEIIRDKLGSLPVTWVEQKEQLGTGHAVSQVLPYLKSDDQILVLYGDVPLTSLDTLKALQEKIAKNGLGLLVASLQNPFGFGRIVRNEDNNIVNIVEEKDATIDEKRINEIFSGILVTSAENLQKWLPQLRNTNAQGEYYLTDIVKLAVRERHSITNVTASVPEEIQGVNNRLQLSQLERYYQRQLAEKFLADGVMIMDPQRFDVRGSLKAGKDVTIDFNVLFEGEVTLGANCIIEPNCILRDVTVGDNVTIKANTIIENATIANDCVVGPFARIRPGTELKEGVRIGNFVETKKAVIGFSSKVNHLSYIGDAVIGENVNIGAGTITCNYDGVNKHLTQIKNGAFIGSNTALVAPVTVGEGAVIGAGSTITKNTPDKTLTLSRAKQTSLPDWLPPKKNKEEIK